MHANYSLSLWPSASSASFSFVNDSGAMGWPKHCYQYWKSLAGSISVLALAPSEYP